MSLCVCVCVFMFIWWCNHACGPSVSSSSPPLPASLFIYLPWSHPIERQISLQKGQLAKAALCDRAMHQDIKTPASAQKKNQSTTPGCIRGREGHLSHLSECHAGWLCDSVPITPPCTPGWACLPHCFPIHACHPGAASWLSNKSLGFSVRCEGKHHTAQCSLTKNKRKKKNKNLPHFFQSFIRLMGGI